MIGDDVLRGGPSGESCCVAEKSTEDVLEISSNDEWLAVPALSRDSAGID